LARELLENGMHGMARAAPGGPEVDHDRSAGLEHVLLEACVRDVAHDRHSYKRPVSARSLRSGTFQIASSTIARLIFEPPCCRSTNAIGTSRTRKPARTARYVISI